MDATPAPSVKPASTGPDLVRSETVGRVLRVTLSNAAGRNLLTPEMMAALSAALDGGTDAGARVIVLASEGPAFSAGHDMKAMAARHADSDGGAAYFRALFEQCSALMTKIATVPQPVIAEVRAVAVAAGCQLVAAADLAVAADTARFGTTGVTFGLYCSTPAVPLTRSVAAKHAAEMLMTGDVVDADHALRIGLVNRVVPASELTDSTMVLASHIAEKSAAVLALGKRAVRAQAGLPLEGAYASATDAMVENLLLADGREGLAAFAAKRPARWQDDV